jgi:uncharacterized protein (TIGR00255 family)
MGKPVLSMTGFSSIEGEVAGLKLRIEMKTLNHKFLDIKLRMPREFSSADLPLRAAIQSAFARGSIDFKVERISTEEQESQNVEPNLELAARYHESMVRIQKALGLTDAIRTSDIAGMPEVISRASREFQPEEAWKQLEPVARNAMKKLMEMRAHEGSALIKVISASLEEMETFIDGIRSKRKEWEAGYREKIREKIQSVFEAHPIAEAGIQAVLESRIAQELALILDRTDIEEELTRFKGHLGHFRKIINEGGPVGRKLDFVLQELHREINTLGNKAQDFRISEQVVDMKVRLEQMREQVMNLE